MHIPFKFLGYPVKPVQPPKAGSNPESPFIPRFNGIYLSFSDTVHIVWIMPEMGEFVCPSVIGIQTRFGSDPDDAVGAGHHRPYGIMPQAVGIIRVMPEIFKYS